MTEETRNLTGPDRSHLQVFIASCALCEFALGEARCSVPRRYLEEERHLRHCLSEVLLLELALDARPPILRLVEDETPDGLRLVALGQCVSPPINCKIRSVTPLSSASISLSGRGGLNT